MLEVEGASALGPAVEEEDEGGESEVERVGGDVGVSVLVLVGADVGTSLGTGRVQL